MNIKVNLNKFLLPVMKMFNTKFMLLIDKQTQMVNTTHFRVLFKKNLLTLRRKWGFALAFVLLPIVTMGIFTAIKYAISDGISPERHNFDCKLSCPIKKYPNNILSLYSAGLHLE